MTVDIEQDGQLVRKRFRPKFCSHLNVNIRIDVSPTNPYSKFAREQSLENALGNGHITFDEYVEALDDDGTAPKGKFKDILDKRAALMEQQALEKEQSAQAQLEQAMGIIDQQNALLAQYEGGSQNAM